jgi:hypothetical protein
MISLPFRTNANKEDDMKTHYLLGAAVTVIALVAVPATSSAVGPTPLAPQEVQALYSGNTWVWDNGAGYFAPDGSFQAWTQDSQYGLMQATGRWSVEIGGQLCYSARWHYQDTSSTSQDCFAHRASNGAILQRDERALGEWYVFNVAQNLRPGNLVAARAPALAAGIHN